MKKTHLTLTLQRSTFFIQDFLLFSSIAFIALVSPFFTWNGLHYDLFSSVVFFSLFNHLRFALICTSCIAFYIDTVMAMPLGSTTMLVLSLWLMNQIIQRFLKKRTFMIHWVSFSVIYLWVIAIKFIITDLFLNLPCQVLTEIYSYIFTIAGYPILCCILADIFSYFTFKSK